jgi:hypothetical protein
VRNLRRLPDPQTQSDGIDATDATFDPQGNYSFDFDLDWADDFTWGSAYDAEWNSAAYPGLLGTPPVLAASQSDIVDEELPVQGSSTALVYYGMVISIYLPVVYRVMA